MVIGPAGTRKRELRAGEASSNLIDRLIRELNMVMGSVGLWTKNHRAGEAQQQFSSQSVWTTERIHNFWRLPEQSDSNTW
jgi:hypothetical protein